MSLDLIVFHDEGAQQHLKKQTDVLAPYFLFKIWIKPGQEQSFLYGNHITRAGLGRITEATPQYQGVMALTMADVPMGFGVAAQGTLQCRSVEMNQTVLFRESDLGEYLRDEAKLS